MLLKELSKEDQARDDAAYLELTGYRTPKERRAAIKLKWKENYVTKLTLQLRNPPAHGKLIGIVDGRPVEKKPLELWINAKALFKTVYRMARLAW